MYQLLGRLHLFYFLIIISISLASHNCFAKKISYYLKINSIYDEAITTNFDEQDSDPLSDNGIGVTHGLNYKLNNNININYEAAEENYEKVKEGDNRYKIITAEYSNQFKDIDNLIFLSNMHLKFAGDELKLNMITHNISFFLRKIYVTINNTWSEKKLTKNIMLDGKSLNSSISGYYFFNTGKTFTNLSLKRIDEEINNNIYSFKQDSLTTGLHHKFKYRKKKCKVYLGYSLHLKDYINNNISSYKTFENKKKFRTYIDMEINPTLSARLLYEYQNRLTNLKKYSYDSNKFTVSMKYEFN